MKRIYLSAAAALSAAALLAACGAMPGASSSSSTSSSSGGAAQQPAAKAEPAKPATTTSSSSSSAKPANTRVVKSRDGRFDGEIVGNPAANSKFAKLKIGMELNEVSQLIGAANTMNSHETGKRWIPFYFGNDTRRVQLDYNGEGCLFFTGGNVYGGGGNELVKIIADPSMGLCKE
jgi:hypothetical protein